MEQNIHDVLDLHLFKSGISYLINAGLLEMNVFSLV